MMLVGQGNGSRAKLHADRTQITSESRVSTLTKEDRNMSDISDDILKHINAALAFERSGRKITTQQAFSKGKSERQMCLGCGVGIRKETTPVNGMHPKCNLVASDPAQALKQGVNSHAARMLHDRIVMQQKLNDADLTREAADAIAHAEMLKRFEAIEESRNAS